MVVWICLRKYSLWLKPLGLRVQNDAAPVPLLQYSCAIGVIVTSSQPERLRRLTWTLVESAKGRLTGETVNSYYVSLIVVGFAYANVFIAQAAGASYSQRNCFLAPVNFCIVVSLNAAHYLLRSTYTASVHTCTYANPYCITYLT